MPNYQNGQIYKIHSYQTDDIYIGSTTQTLCKRFAHHKALFKKNIHKTTSKSIFKYDNVMITLIEKYPCNDKNELEQRERYYIENNNCVNKYIPTRTDKEYYEDNKDKIIQYVKEYRDNNKNKVLKYQKEYRETNKNKERKKQNGKQYYNNNKDKIKQKRKIYLNHKNSHFGIICKSYGIFD